MEWQQKVDQSLMDNLHNAAGRLYAELCDKGCGCSRCSSRAIDRFDEAVGYALKLGGDNVEEEAYRLSEIYNGEVQWVHDREKPWRLTPGSTMEKGMSDFW